MAGTVQGATPTASAVVRCETCGANNRVPPAAEGVARCAKCHSPLPWIVTADDSSFDAVAVRARLPVLVDLWATWCGPCRAVSPALEQVARRLAGRVKLVKVDVDASPAVARRFEVQAVPTLVVLKDGAVLSRRAGAAPARDLEVWVEEALSSQ
jgi:thioredoxin 2